MFDIESVAHEILRDPEISGELNYIAKMALDDYSLKIEDDFTLYSYAYLLGDFQICASESYVKGFTDCVSYLLKQSLMTKVS